MSDFISIDELIENIERAREDEQTPPWVAVLLQTVLILMKSMESRFASMQADFQAALDKQMAENQALRKQLYGQKSERKSVLKATSKSAMPRPKSTKTKPARKGPAALDNTDLPERQIVHEVSSEQLTCSTCGGSDFEDMGVFEESVRYHYEPAKLVRERHLRKKCRCKNGCGIVTAPAPKGVITGGKFSSSLYADIVTKRSFDAIPFHRQADAFARQGIPLSATTLCDLFHTSADVLRPLYDVLAEELRSSPYLHADETPQPVLDINKTKRSYVWTFSSKSLVAYVHTASRSGQTPLKMLENSQGVLVVDGYSGYNKVTTPESRMRAGCMAHARRKFVEAEGQLEDEMRWILEAIGKIYAVEQEAKERGIVGTSEHLELRKIRSRPQMEQLKDWVQQIKPHAHPGSKLDTACTYFENQWDALRVFLDDPKVPVDNNHAERMLRRIALARKTSMFVGYDGSGQRYAINLSFVASCRLNNVNPAAYLSDVLIRIQNTPKDQLRSLLPDQWKPEL